MKMKFSDLVKDALNLTQVNESEIFSWERLCGIGNGAIRKVWDTISRHQDNFFVESFNIATVNPVEFPPDFYALQGVVNERGEDLRRSDLHTNLAADQYRIINNTIQVGTSRLVTVLYNRRPPDLTMPIPLAKTSRHQLKINAEFLGEYDGQSIRLRDLERREEVFGYELQHGRRLVKWDVTIDGNIIVLLDSELLIIDGRLEHPFIFSRVEVDDFFLDSSCYAVYTREGAVYEVDDNLDVKIINRPFAPSWGNLYVQVKEGALLVSMFGTVAWDAWETVEPSGVDNLVVDKNGKYISYTFNGTPFIRSAASVWQPERGNITEIATSSERGDGFNCIVYQARKWSLTNVYPDTVLDYPNTAYFDVIVSTMAEEMLMQLRQDLTEAKERRAGDEATLLSMLARNRSDAYRVRSRYDMRTRG